MMTPVYWRLIISLVNASMQRVKEKTDSGLIDCHAINSTAAEELVYKRKTDCLHQDLISMQQKLDSLKASVSKLMETFHQHLESTSSESQFYKTLQEVKHLNVSPRTVDILSEQVGDLLRDDGKTTANRRDITGATHKRASSALLDKENENVATKRSKPSGLLSGNLVGRRRRQGLQNLANDEEPMKASKGGVSFTIEL